MLEEPFEESVAESTRTGGAAGHADVPGFPSSEPDLQDFFENASVGLHWIGSDGTILRANKTELDMLGYTHDEYVGHHVTEFYADPERITDILLRLQRGEAVPTYEMRMRCKDGSLREVSINSNVLWDNGRFVHTRCFTLDITDRKRVEETKSWLAAIVDSSQDAIVSKTTDGTILSWNKGAEVIFGYTADEAVGRSITLIIPPDRLDEERSILERIRRGERIEHYETVRQRKDGRHIDISVTISPVRDGAGRIVGASKVARDITDRKRAEEALRESERRFRLALASGTVTVFEQDVGLRYTWLYPHERAFPNGYLGRSDLELLPPDEGTELTALKRQAMETDQPVRATVRVTLPDDIRYYNLVVEPRRDAEGRLVGVCGAAVDVTTLKKVEAALRDADRRKDEFLAVLAHELRNPLAPMRSALQIMHMAGDNVIATGQVRSIMERQIQQMVRLVDDLLDVSRITRGNVVLKKGRVSLSSVVASAVETSRPLIEAADHALHVCMPAEDVELEADAARMAQVLSNLLNNAAKYSEPGGQIWLTAELEGDGHLSVTVRDTGIGIPPDMLSRVFDMFTQVDRSSGKSQGGLGVGLTLVRTLVEMHGGSVTVRSDGPGLGSEFTVRLPLPAEHRSSSDGASGGIRHGSAAPKRRVLLVDDNADAAQSLAMLLQVLGHEVRTAADGPAALQAAREFRPQVAFLDLGMPGMSGYELARRLRDMQGDSIVLVALTGWGQEEDRRRSRDAGFDEHLTKPAEISSIEAILAGLRLPVPSPL